jgi:hypothetical protein
MCDNIIKQQLLTAQTVFLYAAQCPLLRNINRRRIETCLALGNVQIAEANFLCT